MFGLPFSQAPFSTLGTQAFYATQVEESNAIASANRSAQQFASNLAESNATSTSSISVVGNASILELVSASSTESSAMSANRACMELLLLRDSIAASNAATVSAAELSFATASADRAAQLFASLSDVLSALSLPSAFVYSSASVFELADAAARQSSGVAGSVTDLLGAYESIFGSMLAASSVIELLPASSAASAALNTNASAVELLSAIELAWATNLLNSDSLSTDFAPRPVIQPVDSFIKAGFAEQMKRQFRCPAIFVSSSDRLRNLQALLGNRTPSYPYIFLSIQSVSTNQDSYMSHKLARGGVPVSLNADNNQIQTTRLVPANFEIEVTYVTNKYSGEGTDSVEGYIRRWLFARRVGSMNFNVDYGLTQLSISYSITDSAPVPVRDNPADAESLYMFTSVITLHGFTSEPELSSVGRINQIQLAHPAGSGQFFAF